MNNLNHWSDGVILAWIAGGLAVVFIFFLLYDSYRIKKRITRYGRTERPESETSRAKALSAVSNYSGATSDQAKVHADRKEVLMELQRRYEASFNQLIQRQRDIKAATPMVPDDETVDPPKMAASGR